MRILSIYEPGELVLEDLPRPPLTRKSAVVKMELCGICGSDVTAYRGTNPTMKYPIQGLAMKESAQLLRSATTTRIWRLATAWRLSLMSPAADAICVPRAGIITAPTFGYAASIKTV